MKKTMIFTSRAPPGITKKNQKKLKNTRKKVVLKIV